MTHATKIFRQSVSNAMTTIQTYAEDNMKQMIQNIRQQVSDGKVKTKMSILGSLLIVLTILTLPPTAAAVDFPEDGGACRIRLYNDAAFGTSQSWFEPWHKIKDYIESIALHGKGMIVMGDGYKRPGYAGFEEIYEHRNFRNLGERAEQKYGNLNNEFSSVLFDPDCEGYTLVLYDEEDFQGESLVVLGDMSHLSDVGWNDRAKSARVYKPGTANACQLKLYSEDNYEGNIWGMAEGIHRVYSSSAGGSEISSLRFIGDCGTSEVTLFEGENYDIGWRTFSNSDNSYHNLSDYGWNDRTKTWTVTFNSGPTPSPRGCVLYLHSQSFTGAKWAIARSQTINDVYSSSAGGSDISSVTFSGDCGNSQVHLFEETDYGDDANGVRAVVRVADGAQRDLVNTNWDDRAQSWTVYFADGPTTPTPPGTPVPVGNCEVRLHDQPPGGAWWGTKRSSGDVYSTSQGAGAISYVEFVGNCGNSAVLLYSTPNDQSTPRTIRAADGYDRDLSGTDWNDVTQFWTVYFSDAAPVSSQVPNVVGKTVAEGQGKLQNAWYTPLRVDIHNTTDQSLDGTIESTDPAPGAALAPGGTVHYIQYRYTPPVPSVVGMTLADGQASLQAAGFVPLRVDIHDTTDQSLDGTIKSTDPAAGAALAPGGTVHYIQYRYTPIATFHSRPGQGIDIGAGGQSYGVWMVDTNHNVSYWSTNQWIQAPAIGADRIDVGPDGQAWVVSQTKDVFQMVNGNWVQRPGAKANDIGVGDNDDVWIVGDNAVAGGPYDIQRWDGTTWQTVPGGARRIDVDPNGNPWVVQGSGTIYRYINNAWEHMPGSASDISIGANGDVWILGNASSVAGGPNAIYRWNESTSSWDVVPGGAAAIAVDALGQPWVVQGAGHIYWGSLN